MMETLAVNKPWLMLGDCLERMQEIPDGSIDMVMCDMPYGTTSCRWDSVIPLESLWEQYRRIVKVDGAIVLTCMQPFTSILVTSKLDWFRYQMVWDKKNCSGFASSSYRPLTAHEDICLFSRRKTTYNPQMVERTDQELKRLSYKTVTTTCSDVLATPVPGMTLNRFDARLKHPTTVIRINGVMNRSKEKAQHPTQKPIVLMEYLILTYTNECETVLDNCMGSGTTGVACVNTGRRFIGIEQHEPYFETGRRRIAEAIAKAAQPAPYGGLFDAQAAD